MCKNHASAQGNPKQTWRPRENFFNFGWRCGNFYVNGYSLAQRGMKNLPLKSCRSLRFENKLFAPVSGREIDLRTSVTRMTWSLSITSSNEESHEEKESPFPSFLLIFAATAAAYGWLESHKSVVYAAGKDESSTSTTLTDIRLQKKRKQASRMHNMRTNRENQPPAKLCHEDSGDDQVITSTFF